MESNLNVPAPGEIEVFKNPPEPSKCYKYVEYTRTNGKRGKAARFFTTNEPRDIGACVGIAGDPFRQFAVFKMNRGNEVISETILYERNNNVCFIETPCPIRAGLSKNMDNVPIGFAVDGGGNGGSRRRNRRTRRKRSSRRNRR